MHYYLFIIYCYFGLSFSVTMSTESVTNQTDVDTIPPHNESANCLLRHAALVAQRGFHLFCLTIISSLSKFQAIQLSRHYASKL